MSKKTAYLLGILLTILIGTYFYWKLCCGGDVSSGADYNKEEQVDTGTRGEDANASKVSATINPFSLSDSEGDFSFNSGDNFNFDTSGYTILRPISETINGGIDELQIYLGGNENKSIDVTGLYASSEENNSAFPNLGMARANAVKNYLITRGIPSSRMNLFGNLKDDMVADGVIYRGPVNFGFSEVDENSAAKEKADLDAIRKRIQADPLILNFATAQSSINLTEAQRQKIADIARYLDKVEGGKAIVTGHTDNTGSREGNISIGQKRADFAKGYLVRNGISEAKISAIGKGPDEPIASNATEEGRAKNRRTVVTVN